MKSTQPLSDLWADQPPLPNDPQPSLQANANKLAFADPEFLLSPHTLGIRFQLEMLKPDLAQQALGIENTIVVFGSARLKPGPQAQAALEQAQIQGEPRAIAQAQALLRNAPYYDQARAFARIVARYSARCEQAGEPEKRLFICTGGGPGIMQAANQGAHDEGALNIGLNITLPHEQTPNPYISESLNFKFHYFALRKMHFTMRAKALVVFPGGFGTLDELFEIITLVQCKKVQPVPILLFGSHYWKRLINFDVLIEEGTICPEDIKLFEYVDDPKIAWDRIMNFYHLSE